MAYIRLDIGAAPVDGQELTFKAPCSCLSAAGIKVYYPEGSMVFTFKDANSNDLTDYANLFIAGAIVKVVLDTESAGAYIMNANTNMYLESAIKMVSNDTRQKMPFTGGMFTGNVRAYETARTTRGLFNEETRADSTTGTLKSVKYFINVVEEE